MTNPQAPSTIIAQTPHSLIEKISWNGQPAVLKTCRNPNEPRTRLRWEKEVEALKLAGSHTNIALLLASSPLTLTLTLRLEPGKSLDQYLSKHQQQQQQQQQQRCTLPPTDGTTILRQQASALAHLHTHHLIHDDVKPKNIIWDPLTQQSVLIDFGAALFNLADLPSLSLSPSPSPSPSPTPTEKNINNTNYDFNPSGTPSYVPPEFLKKKKGPAGDVWALGVVMLFVWGYVRLPDGNWFLPGVWEEEGGDVEMRAWLDEVREVKEMWCEQRPVLREMLNEDPEQRISSVELCASTRTNGG